MDILLSEIVLPMQVSTQNLMQPPSHRLHLLRMSFWQQGWARLIFSWGGTMQQTGLINSWQGSSSWKCVLDLNSRRSSLLEHHCLGIIYRFYNVQRGPPPAYVLSICRVISQLEDLSQHRGGEWREQFMWENQVDGNDWPNYNALSSRRTGKPIVRIINNKTIMMRNPLVHKKIAMNIFSYLLHL